MKMTELVDTISYENPAYNACLIGAYINGAISTSYMDMYLILPVLYYDNCIKYFEGTNKNTGILRWIYRNPELQTFFSDAVYDLAILSKEAISFLASQDLLSINNNGYFSLKENTFIKKIDKSNDDLLKKKVKYAKRFGYWIHELNDSKLIYQSLGV